MIELFCICKFNRFLYVLSLFCWKWDRNVHWILILSVWKISDFYFTLLGQAGFGSVFCFSILQMQAMSKRCNPCSLQKWILSCQLERANVSTMSLVFVWTQKPGANVSVFPHEADFKHVRLDSGVSFTLILRSFPQIFGVVLYAPSALTFCQLKCFLSDHIESHFPFHLTYTS